MSGGKQKNFTIPKSLEAEWMEFSGRGSKESSKNAAGAMMLFMLMPSHVREAARNAAYLDSSTERRAHFWEAITRGAEERRLASELLVLAQASEQVEHKKKRGNPSKAG